MAVCGEGGDKATKLWEGVCGGEGQRDAGGRAVKNWLLVGLYVAYMEDGGVDAAKKDQMRDLIGKEIVNAEGNIDTQNFGKIAHMVTHIEVTAAKYASYLTISVTGVAGGKVLTLMEEAWAKEAKTQVDPPPPKPILKELKEMEMKARAVMKGGGKGV